MPSLPPEDPSIDLGLRELLTDKLSWESGGEAAEAIAQAHRELVHRLTPMWKRTVADAHERGRAVGVAEGARAVREIGHVWLDLQGMTIQELEDHIARAQHVLEKKRQ